MYLRVIHQVFSAISQIDQEMVGGTSIFTICHGMGKRKYTKQFGSLDNKAAAYAADSQETHCMAVNA